MSDSRATASFWPTTRNFGRYLRCMGALNQAIATPVNGNVPLLLKRMISVQCRLATSASPGPVFRPGQGSALDR